LADIGVERLVARKGNCFDVSVGKDMPARRVRSVPGSLKANTTGKAADAMSAVALECCRPLGWYVGSVPIG
jgi:hypothetical protein